MSPRQVVRLALLLAHLRQTLGGELLGGAAGDTDQEKREVLLGIRLLGTTFGVDCQTIRLKTAQLHLVEQAIVVCQVVSSSPRLRLKIYGPARVRAVGGRTCQHGSPSASGTPAA